MISLAKSSAPFRQLRVVDGLDPERIPCDQQNALAPIPECEGEHAVESLDEGLAFGSKPLQEHLAVARGTERAAARLEPRAEFAEIVDLAVEDQNVAAAVRVHGLGGGIGQVQDGKPDVAQSDLALGVFERAAPIGPPVRLRGVHCARPNRGVKAPAQTRYSAHGCRPPVPLTMDPPRHGAAG